MTHLVTCVSICLALVASNGRADEAGLIKEPPTYLIKAPAIERLSQSELKASGGVTITSQDAEVKADTIWMDTISKSVSAKGNVTVTRGDRNIRAMEILGNLATDEWSVPGALVLTSKDGLLSAAGGTYNIKTEIGSLKNAEGIYRIYRITGTEALIAPENIVTVHRARATTCDAEHPHWSIGAKTIEVHDRSYAIASGMGVWIGKTKIFAFPRYKFMLKHGTGTNLLPTPGFDQSDGAYLRFRYPIFFPWATAASVSGRFTQKNGILSSVEIQRVLQASSDTKSAVRSDSSSDVAESTKPSPTDKDKPPPGLSPEVTGDLTSLVLLSDEQREATLEGTAQDRNLLNRAQVFLRGSWKDRIYDPDARYVYLDRMPELGLRLLDASLGWPSPKKPLRISAQTSIGNYRERSTDQWYARADGRLTVRLTENIGRRVLIEPAFLLRYSSYSSGQDQQIFGASLAAGRKITSQYFGAITYVRHWTSGRSPFEFDDVDVKDKLATRIDADWGSARGSLILDYNLQTGGIYDWGVKLAKVFHCIQPTISYQNRYRDLTVGLAFVMPR